MTAVMVVNLVKGTATIADSTTKAPVKGNRSDDRRQQQDFQLDPRVDTSRCSSLKAEQRMQSTHAQKGALSNNHKLPKKPWLKLTNTRPEETFEEAAKLAEQTQPAVTVAPCGEEAPVGARRMTRPDKEYVMIMITRRWSRNNKVSSQNQVIKEIVTGINNKKNKAIAQKNNRNQAPTCYRAQVPWYQQNSNMQMGMTVAEIAKRIKRETSWNR